MSSIKPCGELQKMWLQLKENFFLSKKYSFEFGQVNQVKLFYILMADFSHNMANLAALV